LVSDALTRSVQAASVTFTNTSPAQVCNLQITYSCSSLHGCFGASELLKQLAHGVLISPLMAPVLHVSATGANLRARTNPQPRYGTTSAHRGTKPWP